jgi:intracellular multiplication protein IcmX
MKKIKKFHTLTITAFCALSLASSTVLAANSNPPSGGGGVFDDVVTAIKQLGVEIQAAAIASAKTVNNAMYQLDQNLTISMQANSPSTDTTVNNAAATYTQNQLSTAFMEFPEKVVNPDPNDSQLVQDINNRQQLLTNLTTNTPASDTLYLSSLSDPLAASDNVAKPTTLNDNYFNFDALLTPNAYTSDQQQAAQSYLTYATESYQSLTDGINFDKLKSTLNNLSPSQRATALQNFLTNPVYQKYQLAIRSLLATKSVALSNLNLLLAERTPIKGLANQAGMPNDPNLPAGYASPLEVENYIATERLNNPQWFQQMKTASPATVQREQVLILAEIENSLQRNHLDNERILATLSIMALQSSQANQLLLKSQAQNVNAVIDPSTSNQGSAQ